MKVLIVGAGLMAQAVAAEMPDAVVLGHDKIDLTSYDSIIRALREHKPDVAINTAAIHNLKTCQANPHAAFDVNAYGAGRLAALIPTVMLSTDYVFSDGGPHEEVMPGRQPRSVYGRSKLAGELETLERDGIVVRISGVYDERFISRKGPSFPETVLTKFENMRFPSDQVFSPTYARDAAKRIAMLAGLAAEGKTLALPGFPEQPLIQGIYHAANDGSVSWADFAALILKAAGRRYKVTPFEAKDPLRPTNSALVSKRLPPLRSWQTALHDYLDRRQALLYANREVSPLRG